MQKPTKALTAAIAVAALLLAGCSNDGATDPTTPPVTLDSSAASAAPSSPTSSSSSSSSTSPTTSKPKTPPQSTSAPTTSAPSTKTSKSTAPTKSVNSVPPAAQRFPVAIPATVKGADRTAAETAVKIYQEMMDTWDQSFLAPGAKDWPKVMSRYLNGGAYNRWRTTLQSVRDADAHGVGYNSAKGTVTAVQLHPDPKFAPNVMIRVCRDISTFASVQAGKTSSPKPGSVVTAQWTLYVEKLPKYGWSIRTLITSDQSGEAVKCAAG